MAKGFTSKALPLNTKLAPRLRDVLGIERLYGAKINGGYPFTKCYWNSAEAAKEFGGRMVLGWKFEVWNNTILQIIHHALIEVDDEFICVTEPSPNFKSSSVTFSPSEKHPLTDDFPPCIPSYFISLKNGIDTKRLNAIHTEMILMKKEAVEIARSSNGCSRRGDVIIPHAHTEAHIKVSQLSKKIDELGKLEDQILGTLIGLK